MARKPKARPKKLKHEEAQRIHACARCRLRYGVSLSPSAYGELNRRIQQGTAKLVEDRGHTVIYDIEWAGKSLRAVYDVETKQIATFFYHDPLMLLYEMVNY